jgi:ectoine hydroxylase-related dioxygenase (phytanoyl-CoA dioxygenase family)
MAPRIQSVDVTASRDELDAILKQDGCVIVRDAIDHAAIDRLLADLAPYLRKKPKGATGFLGYETKRLHSLFAKTPAVCDFIVHDKLMEIMDLTLGPWCDTYRLSSNSITAIGPGETPQMLHRGDSLYPLAHPTERNANCTAFWALTDFTERNGATCLVPGSHTWDDERRPTEAEVVQAVMPKGSFCVFVGAIWHGGGRNVTADEWRIAMFAGYALGWLRQEQNMYLSVPPEMARALPEKVARILGYSIHKPFLGWVADIQDPWDVINGYQELSSGGADQFAGGTDGLVQGGEVKLA